MLLAAVAALLACGRQPVPSYSVRGQVVSVDGSGEDLRALIAHEPIPRFVGRDGKVSRMPAMRMAFGLGSAVDRKPLAPGSKWRFTFEVRWGQEPTLVITGATPLAADTPLTLAP